MIEGATVSQNATECDSLEGLAGNELLAVAVAVSPSVTKAAEMAHCSRATIYRAFSSDLFFPGMVKDAREAVRAARIARAGEIADRATSALLAVLDSEDATTSEQIKAASALLSAYGQR